MSPADDSADDDRTVIRPPGAPAARFDKTLAAGSPPLMDRTLAVGAPPPFQAETHDAGNGLPIGTYLGEFELTKMVGEGGFGIVYLATDHSLQRRVALKEYMPSSLASRTSASNVQVKSERYRETFAAGLKSFINEARLLASFDHPSLVKVYRFWEANGTAYMVMPFYEGKTLKDMLREMGSPPDEAWLRTLLAPLTEALAVIHAEQCYHRDIAPDNVMMLAGSNRPLLLDFGAARRVIGDMTQALTVILKPGYAPVEQYAEIPGMKQGPWTDVYALAAVVYFAIMGKTPPPSVGRLLNDTYVPLVTAAAGRYSESFLAAIDRALAVRPETRTQDIPQLREELGLSATAAPADVFTRQMPASGDARPAPAPQPQDPLPRRPAPAPPPVVDAAPAPKSKAMLGIGIGVVALGAVAIGAYSLLTPAPRPAPPPVVADAPAPPADAASVAAVPAPPPPAAPPPPPASLEPFTEFDRVVQAQNAEFGVKLTAPSTRLSAQREDPIRFNVQAERDGFLYVFLAAEDGTLLMVIPSADQGLVALKKGQTYRFPVINGPQISAAEPLGRDQVLAIVSARQRDFSAFNAKAWDVLPLTRLFPTGPEGGKVLAAHAGPQPALAGRAICPETGACDTSYGAAVLTIDIVK